MNQEIKKSIVFQAKDGTSNEFEYTYENLPVYGRNVWNFFVASKHIEVKNKFQISFTEIDKNTVKCTVMEKNDEYYSAKGIPEKMIEEAFLELNKEVVSSSNSNNHKKINEEFRTDSATKVWIRLKELGKATYNEEEDFYTFINLN